MTDDRYKSSKGYEWIRRPDHPEANFMGLVYRHRLIMEEYLGRALPKGTVVHHRNRDRADNRLENLLLLRCEDDHLALHRAIEAGRADLIEAHESWALQFMENLRSGLPLEECYPAPTLALTEHKKARGLAKTPKVILRRKNPSESSS